MLIRHLPDHGLPLIQLKDAEAEMEMGAAA